MVTHNIRIIDIYVCEYLIKNLQCFIKKLTIYLAGCRKYLRKQSEEYCCTWDGTTTFPKEIKNVNTKSYIG